MKYIGMNGAVIPTAEAVISVMDHGFMYGMGLFETFRTYGGKPFLLHRHLERLKESCRQVGIPYQGDADGIMAEIAELLARNELSDGYFRLTVSAGEGPLGLITEDYAEPTVVLYVKPLPPLNEALYTKGKTLWRLRTPRNTPESEIRLKSLHYMNNVLARRELAAYERQESAAGAGAYDHSASVAVEAGAGTCAALPAEGLLLTANGDVAEGITSNLFFVNHGKLYTPEIGTGILPGITRSLVMELARRCGLKAEEGRYPWDKLEEAEEIFLTNSIQELMPVTLLARPDGKRIAVGGGEIGPVTGRLLDLYRKEVRR
ncbi:aminotransferase class IV [Paenibacillus sp. M1]|uniref:Aminotransferase class IV n=1 Tax=Paenibacillus haidiansis TaxID=1574488 RepID=A0ABU7VZC7_9BACL